LQVSPQVSPQFAPMPLARLPQPFDHPDWIFELKLDGWRALPHIKNGRFELVSRNGNTLKSFPDRCSRLAGAVRGSVVLDGEIVSLGPDGRPPFMDLMRRRGDQHFHAVDILWLKAAISAVYRC